MAVLDLLRFAVRADNLTDGAMKAVKTNIAGVKGALATMDERAKRAGKSLRNIGLGLSVGVTGPLALLGKQSVQLYDTQVKAQAAVEAALASTGGAAGKTAQELFDMASGLQNVSTYGDEDILRNLTAPLLTFTKVQGDVFGRAQAVTLDYATLLQTDLKSAALQVGKALNDPVKGVSALAKAGVQFSDQQKDLIKDMLAVGNVAGAQGIILAELETQFKGQAAAAAATPLGQWQQMSNAIGDVKEQLGQQIVPFIAPLVQQVRDAVQWFGGLSEGVKRAIVVFGAGAAAVGPLLAVLGLATIGVGALVSAFRGLTVAMLTNPIGLFAVGVAAAIAGVVTLANRAGGFGNLLTALKSLAVEVADRIGLGFVVVAEVFREVSATAKATWFDALAEMQHRWALFLKSISGAAFKIPGLTGLANKIAFDAAIAGQGVDGLRKKADELYNTADSNRAAAHEFTRWALAPLESLKLFKEEVEDTGSAEAAATALKVALADVNNEVTDLAGGGGGGQVAKVKDAIVKLAPTAQTIKDGLGSIFGAIPRGADAAKQAVESLRVSLLSLVVKNSGFKLLAGAFPSIFGAGGPIDLVASANGNVFSGGNVVPFARGGVVSSPTTFPLRNGGTGLMGEAGDEAIMPLTRTRSGRLGVIAEGVGGGGGVVPAHVEVHNYGSEPARIERSQGPNGAEMVRVMIGDAIRSGRYDGQFSGRYGATPTARKYA